MSEKALEKLNNNLANIANKFFHEEIICEGCVISVDHASDAFILSVGKHLLKCVSENKITDIEPDSYLRVAGKLIVEKYNVGVMCLNVHRYSPIVEGECYEEDIEQYMNFANQITSLGRIKDQVDRLKLKKYPNLVYDIGIIVPSDQKIILDTFKICFQEYCKGNLFIYKIKSDKDDLVNALRFFNRKRVDIICMLYGNASLTKILALSNPSALKVISSLSRKGIFTVSIFQDMNNNSISTDSISHPIIPLSYYLTNRTYTSVYECIQQISQVQKNLNDKIMSSLEKCDNNMKGMIAYFNHMISLIELESYPPIDRKSIKTKNLISIHPENFDFPKKKSKRVTNDNVDLLKKIIIDLLGYELKKINDIDLKMSKELADISIAKTAELIRELDEYKK